MSAIDPDNEATLIMGSEAVDQDAMTREYRRPRFPTPVEWVRERPRRSKRRYPSHHTMTMTVPALRHLVGMPVVPALAGLSPAAPASAPPSHKRAPLGLAALAAISILAAVSAVGATALLLRPPAPTPLVPGTLVVSAYGVGGLPDGFRVIADGQLRCTFSPCELELDPGEHFVSVVAPGYERERARRVEITAGLGSDMHFELVPRSD